MSTPSNPRHMVHVTIHVAPENVPVVLDALRILFAECWKEPECDFCQIVRSVNEPGVIRIQEAWNASREHLEQVQVNKPYYEPYLKITQPLWLTERKIEIFERLADWTVMKPSFPKDS